MERLQKYMANSGYCSRRNAENLIKKGRVSVNGQVITELGTKVSGKEEIMVDGNLLKKEDKEYYLLNKPRGVITSVKDDKKRKTVVDMINSSVRIYPVGRLDYDTTGVLILTNDGEFANIMMHPNKKIEKVYTAKVRGIIKGEQINQLKNGVELDGRKTEKCHVKLRRVDAKSNVSYVSLVIHEGRNHQVKRMFQAVGFEVIKLKRDRVGIFTLDGLASGEFRKLTPKEVSIVYSLKD